MTRIMYIGCLILVACAPARADQPERATAVKQVAEQLAQATLKDDYAWLIDHTYPPLVEELGGRAKAIERVESAIKQTKDQRMAILAYHIGEPRQSVSANGATYVVVPTFMEATMPGGKLVARSYLLGISPDEGKTWQFVDGAGLANKAFRDRVLPKLPARLQLPDLQAPEFIRDSTERH